MTKITYHQSMALTPKTASHLTLTSRSRGHCMIAFIPSTHCARKRTRRGTVVLGCPRRRPVRSGQVSGQEGTLTRPEWTDVADFLPLERSTNRMTPVAFITGTAGQGWKMSIHTSVNIVSQPCFMDDPATYKICIAV